MASEDITMQAPLALCDDAADEKEWTFIVAETEKLVITGKIEKDSVCVRKIASGESITSGGYQGAPESITSGPIVSYKRTDGSLNGENPTKKIIIQGLPTGNGELEFFIDTKVNQRVDDIKGIVNTWIHEGCCVAGETPVPMRIPKSHWAVRSKRRATPWNMPLDYLMPEDMPLLFSWHNWSSSFQSMQTMTHNVYSPEADVWVLPPPCRCC